MQHKKENHIIANNYCTYTKKREYCNKHSRIYYIHESLERNSHARLYWFTVYRPVDTDLLYKSTVHNSCQYILQSNRRSGAIIRLGFAVDNTSYSVGFPSGQIPADMMFSRT
jgi:hypothetical protein